MQALRTSLESHIELELKLVVFYLILVSHNFYQFIISLLNQIV